MSVVGASDNWLDLLERILPQILQLVVDVWGGMLRPFADDKEDPITKILCRALRQDRTVRALPFSIDFQLMELDPAVGEDLGKLDIAFRPSGTGTPDESIYFCLECKRLNVVKNGQTTPGGSAYVTDGMARFVSGQYSKAVRHGGMLGYVLNGNVPAAIANVQSNVTSHHVSLRMDSPGTLHPSSVLTALGTARESRHKRLGEATQFRIHHLFVDASPPGA